MRVYELHGTRVIEASDTVHDDRAAVDLMALAVSHQAKLIAVPVERLPDGFFRLDTRIAGAIVQKFVQYRIPVAFVGDITEYLAASSALRAFVHEINRGRQIWFVTDETELADRLSAQRNPAEAGSPLGIVGT